MTDGAETAICGGSGEEKRGGGKEESKRDLVHYLMINEIICYQLEISVNILQTCECSSHHQGKVRTNTAIYSPPVFPLSTCTLIVVEMAPQPFRNKEQV